MHIYVSMGSVGSINWILRSSIHAVDPSVTRPTDWQTPKSWNNTWLDKCLQVDITWYLPGCPNDIPSGPLPWCSDLFRLFSFMTWPKVLQWWLVDRCLRLQSKHQRLGRAEELGTGTHLLHMEEELHLYWIETDLLLIQVGLAYHILALHLQQWETSAHPRIKPQKEICNTTTPYPTTLM